MHPKFNKGCFLGVRCDRFWRVVRTSEERIGPIHAVSKNLGGVWHLLPKLGLYYGYSAALKVNTATSLSFFNEGLPPGRSRGYEAGVKVDLVDNRLSGSVAVFKATAENESDVLVAAVRDVVDPTGINGKFGGPNILFDRETRGLEVAHTARPLPRWNLRVGLNWIDGQDGNDLALTIYYNDQFRTTKVNGETVVASSTSGAIAALMVRQTPGNAPTPLIPLTLAMMKDRSSPYFAQLDPASGRIPNASALDLLGSGVGTSVSGLPISDHQLGFAPPTGSTFLVRKGGDVSTGYAAKVLTVATSWRFSRDGFLNGVIAGANASDQAQGRSYDYTDATTRQRVLSSPPDTFVVGVFAGYRRKLFNRYTWSARLSVGNLFSSEEIVIFPRASDGLPGAARYHGSPRQIQWTNTIVF